MLYNYREVIEIYGTDYKLKKAIANKEIYRIESGIYSDQKDNFTNHELVLKKYPAAFLVKNSALYHIGFIEVEPDVIHLGTARNALRIHDRRIKQHFYSNIANEKNGDQLIHSHINDETENEIRLLNLTGLFVDIINDRKKYSKQELITILEKFRDCTYFADDKLDEEEFIWRLLDDMQIFNLVEDICREANMRKWIKADELEDI